MARLRAKAFLPGIARANSATLKILGQRTHRGREPREQFVARDMPALSHDAPAACEHVFHGPVSRHKDPAIENGIAGASHQRGMLRVEDHDIGRGAGSQSIGTQTQRLRRALYRMIEQRPPGR